MIDINKIFYELIQVAIGNRVCLTRTPKIAEWKMLYDIAKKQSLVGICFAGVQKLTINSFDNTQERRSSLTVNLRIPSLAVDGHGGKDSAEE